MSNTAIVSFKLPPDRFAVLKAMAEGQNKALSELVRETVEWALGLERHTRLLPYWRPNSSRRSLRTRRPS